ncbi:50S ribosomal subunit protein L1 [Alphaproteobacteria bacterium]
MAKQCSNGKRVRKARESLLKPIYPLSEALMVLDGYREKYKAKFDETVEVVFALGIDAKQSDQMVRGSALMPYGLGKVIRVAAFVKAEKVEAAMSAGAHMAGNDDLVDLVKAGKLDFDVCVSTPDMMPKIASLGKILGPKGMMPNPKLGTVGEDIVGIIKRVKAGQVEFKVEKAGIIHAGVGKLSFGNDALLANIRALYDAIVAVKPQAAKGIFMQKMYISTSQGVSIALDLASIAH